VYCGTRSGHPKPSAIRPRYPDTLVATCSQSVKTRMTALFYGFDKRPPLARRETRAVQKESHGVVTQLDDIIQNPKQYTDEMCCATWGEYGQRRSIVARRWSQGMDG